LIAFRGFHREESLIDSGELMAAKVNFNPFS
jgi:hypothetical protein